MIKPIFLYLPFLFLHAMISSAQETPKEIVSRFFAVYEKDPGKAVEFGFSTNKWMDRKQDEIIQVKSKLQNLVDLCGTYYGYELLSEKSAGKNLLMVVYIVRYDREPIRFSFFFYRPKDRWQLNNFSFDEGIDGDLEEATKAYRLRENMEW